MPSAKKKAEQFQKSLNELYPNEPWFDSYLDPIIAALEELEQLVYVLAERDKIIHKATPWMNENSPILARIEAILVLPDFIQALEVCLENSIYWDGGQGCWFCGLCNGPGRFKKSPFIHEAGCPSYDAHALLNEFVRPKGE